MKHLNRVRKPDGRELVYYRPKGQKAVRLPDESDPSFLEAYMKAAGLTKVPKPPAKTGTLAAAIQAFIRSDIYLGKAVTTRATWQRTLEDIERRYGKVPVDAVTTKNIRADLARLPGNPANNRRKVWRALTRWCLDVGLIDDDPALPVRAREVAKGKGHTPWTREDVQAFRDRWPLGTEKRAAFELIYWTGARISDAVRLGPGMVDKDGWLVYVQQKTEKTSETAVAVPFTAPAPSWAEPDGLMLEALNSRNERHMTFLATQHGSSRSVKAASQWFSAAAREAGITGKSAHGLRKLRAIIMRENGATTDQRAAWLGHDSLKEVEHYGQDADRRLIISGSESSNGSDPVTTQRFKVMK